LSTTDNDNEFVVKAEVPGFDANDLNVQINENLLTIEAERKRETDKEKELSRFRRSVMLPAGIDAEKAQATYRNGVLELRFAKTEKAKAKRIQVVGAASTPQEGRGPQVVNQQAAGSPKKS
jgi:HSP20 family protein